MNDLRKIKETILLTGMYYGKDLPQPVLAMMAEDLKSYPAETVEAAYAAYRRNGRNRTFPLPAQILDIIEASSVIGGSSVLATKLIAAVKKHDYTWPLALNPAAYQTGSFKGDFIAELGEEAWHVVALHGGWGRFCESFWNSPEGTFKAQLRDVCEGFSEKRKAGEITAKTERAELSSPRASLSSGPTHASNEISDLLKTKRDPA